MALKYVTKKTVFGFDKTNTVKYVARPLLTGTVMYTALCEQVAMASMGAVPVELVMRVLDSLTDVLRMNLINCRSVKLDEFGTLRPSFNCKCQDSEMAVDENVVHRRKIIFTASGEFKAQLNNFSVQNKD